jgi:transcriptional regulator with XRE-family HTH domain
LIVCRQQATITSDVPGRAAIDELRPQETIGQRIRRLRKERGLSQRQVSGRGVSHAHLSRIESGGRQPSTRALRLIARKLGVSVDYLETGIDVTTREELELKLSELELRLRLEPEDREIERELTTLITLAEREAEADIGAKTRVVLGLALASWGRPGDALSELTAATTHPVIRPQIYPNAYRALARALCDVGRTEEGVELCELVLKEVGADGDRALCMIFATELSQALSDLGEFDRAQEVLEDYAGEIEEADPYARARIHWSLARVATLKDERRLALRHMRQAIGLLQGTEDTLLLARAHLLCAEILLWGSKTAGVAQHLRAARKLFLASTDTVDQSMLRSYEALLLARQGRFDKAVAAADEALQLIPEHDLERGPALHAKALGLAGQGAYADAEPLFRAVLALAEKSQWWLAAGVVAKDLGEMLRWAGKPAESEASLAQAALFATRSREPADAAEARR